MEKGTLSAKLRNELKKNKVKKLRNEGFIPCVIYGDNKDNKLVYINDIEYEKALRTDYLKNTIIKITVDENGKETEELVVTYDLQKDVIKRKITHVDFIRVNKNTPIKLTVPIKFEGVAPGTKRGGVQIKKMETIELSVLPEDIPTHIPVDLSSLQIGEFITVNDIEENKFTILSPKSNSIVRISAPRKAVETSDESAAETSTEESSEQNKEEN